MRAKAFADLGADILFVEAPLSEAELERIGAEVPAPRMANIVEGGDTPMLAPARLEAIGYGIVAYPLALLSAAVRAMQYTLGALKAGAPPGFALDFAQLRNLVGFDDYDAELARYEDA